MAQWLHDFWLEEEGQDLIEYSVMITFIAVTCLAFVFSGTAQRERPLDQGEYRPGLRQLNSRRQLTAKHSLPLGRASEQG